MMNRRFIFAAVTIVLAAALGIAFFILNRAPAAQAAAGVDTPKTEYLIKLEGEDDVALVKAENGQGGFIMEARPSESESEGVLRPALSGWEDFKADRYLLGRVFSVSGALLSRGLVEEAPEDLARFGLDVPRAVVRIRSRSGGEITLSVGNPAPDRTSAYVMKGGDTAVYLAYASETDLFLKGPLEFIDKELSPRAEQDENGGPVFEEIILGGEVRRGEEIVIRPAEPAGEEFRGFGLSPYRMQRPMEADINVEKFRPSLEALFGLSALELVARIESSAELQKYGLAEPYSSVRVNGTLGQGLGGFALRTSQPDNNNEKNVFIQREGVNLVYKIAASALPWLTVSWFDIMNRIMVLPYINSVSVVEVIIRGKPVSFNLTGEDDDFEVRSGGVVVDTDNFRKYYQTLISAACDERTAEKPATADPALEIRYHYRDGRPSDRVTFYENNSRRYFSRLNDGPVFFTQSVYVDTVIGDLDKLLKGEKLRSFF